MQADDVRTLVRTVECGAAADCPFCIGRMIASVSVGDRIVFLQGSNAGREATVTAERGFNDGEFLVHFDLEPQEHQSRVIYNLDRFSFAPIESIPDWLCHLSTDDLSALDEAIVQTSVLFRHHSGWSIDVLIPILSTIRSRRLPVAGTDLWPTLEAHGWPTATRDDFEDRLAFAIETLVAMVGRPAIRRKLVPPMSIGRYRPQAHRGRSSP